uniref:Neuropeptide Y n=1 Tax=Leptobrachium leishanense TaxID=445787 RepID=A0A8C5PWR2_9ANUR
SQEITRAHISAVLFILLALTLVCSTAPSEPQHPGDQASQEQLAKYYSDLWQYITFITRPSRSGPEMQLATFWRIACTNSACSRAVKSP